MEFYFVMGLEKFRLRYQNVEKWILCSTHLGSPNFIEGCKPLPDVGLRYLYNLDLDIRLGFSTFNLLGLLKKAWNQPFYGFLPMKGASRSWSSPSIFYTEDTISSLFTVSPLRAIIFIFPTLTVVENSPLTYAMWT